MAKATNNFIQGKMNKDLDDRLLPKGEYRNAVNAQISRSEGPNVGALENVLGNTLIADLRDITGNDDVFSIGYCTDEINERVFVFLTNQDNALGVYDHDSYSCIVQYNAVTQASIVLVEGAFLNFSIQFPITGVNILENLLFWTDNRNQPRKINVSIANPKVGASPTYYQTEDQISVAKYNPYQPIELYRPASNVANAYETSMYDVVSKYYPDGGLGYLETNYAAASTTMKILKSNYEGDLPIGATIAYIKDGVFYETDKTVTNVVGGPTGLATYFTLTLSGGLGEDLVTTVDQIIFNYNEYFEIDYNGDKDYLEELFVRFAYRYKFEDGEYSIMSPFTQPCFIPKQDGYFMHKVNSNNTTGTSTTPPNAINSPILDVTDEEDTYRSTVVEFMENKVNKIILRIPLPSTMSTLNNSFKIDEIDILYKESTSNNISVIESVSIDRILSQYATAKVDGATTTSTEVDVDNISGTIKVGSLVSGVGITDNPVVVSFNTTDKVILSSTQSLADNVDLTFGDNTIFEYEYQSTKPYKVLPSSETTRTYDKVPVRALAQEVISNRIVYGNFLNKHTPPSSLDYNIAVSAKSDFNLGTATTTNTALEPQGETIIAINTPTGSWTNGYVVTSSVAGAVVGGTVIASNTGTTITLSTGLANALAAGSTLTFTAPNSIRNTTSKIEYPNHSIKQNRNYQVGVVLSDRYGRQSTVILSDGDNSVKFNNENYLGSTVYSDYIASSVEALSFPGESIKILFNNSIPGGSTGLYNGDVTTDDYNPLGWYTYKIVVKQTQQEYYNVYLPGVMAAYPTDPTKELNKTSHTVLISDNINKVPRDLVTVGPEQKQFRSSIMLHGRVENVNSINVWQNNTQYYPGKIAPIVSVIATDDDMFNGISQTGYVGSPEFYNVVSNPLIARINTPSGKFGVAAVLTTADVGSTSLGGTDVLGITIASIDPFYSGSSNSIFVGQTVTGNGIPEGTTIVGAGPDSPYWKITLSQNTEGTTVGDTLTFTPTNDSVNFGWVTMPQLAVMETDPVESDIDIFWETSTAGIITELNQAISGGTAEGVSFGFNTDNFDEAIKPGSTNNNPNMCSANFNILNQFGNNITYADTTPPQFQLTEVKDFNDNIIPIGASGIFKLVRDNSKYNVEVLDTFYYSNQHSVNDTYSFKFEINYDGQQTFITQSPVSLGNIVPLIATETQPGTYVPGTGNGVDTLGTFNKLDATNGAAFGVGITPQAWKDLTWTITVTKGGVDYGPNGEGDVTIVQSQVNNYWRARFNFVGGDTPTSMVDGTYVCVATVEDAGALQDSYTFNLVIDRTPCYTYKFTYTGSNSSFSVNYTNCQGVTANVALQANIPANTFPGYQVVCAANNQTNLTNKGFVKLALDDDDMANSCPGL